MTNQETFNKICEHLKAQGGPATTANYLCEDGTKCAIGGLIPDDKYDPSFEGDTGECDIVDAAGKHPEILDAIGNHDIEFLDAMQMIHDGYETLGEIMDNMNEYAKRHNLDGSATK